MFRLELSELHKVLLFVGHGRYYDENNKITSNALVDELKAWLKAKNVSIIYAHVDPNDDIPEDFALIFDYVNRCSFYFNNAEKALAFKLKFG